MKKEKQTRRPSPERDKNITKREMTSAPLTPGKMKQKFLIRGTKLRRKSDRVGGFFS